jgi:hypothetical protein
MKNIALGLVLALTLSTPALASSWKNELFTKLDADASGEISLTELTGAGCRVKPKMFAYADKNRSNGLSKSEYFRSRDLLGRCK